MTRRIDLNGTWQLGYSDGERGRPEDALAASIEDFRYFPAQVPGCVHLDLMREGLLEDPVLGLNSLHARWVEECIWSYRKEFNAPELTGRGRAWLVFEGLDLAARIFLNGEEVGAHENAFVPCRVDVTQRLRAGRNWVTVILESGLIGAGDKPAASLGNQNAYAYSKSLHKSHWLRKPAFQFGWDWTARLGNVGITGDAYLEIADHPVRVDQVVPLVTVAPDLTEATVTVRAHLENTSETTQRLTLVAAFPLLETDPLQTCEVPPGIHSVESTFPVREFELWHPRGAGAQKLYALEIRLHDDDGQPFFSVSRRIGFRYIEFFQGPHPESGRYCILKINHRPLFLKGANWIPADMLLARIDDHRYATLIDRALEAHFNFIRVWGGGLYESERFFDLCDEHGIVVWQDFAYACSKYPLYDEALFENAKDEARFQIRRLASHPSLAVWCGNNEMELGNWAWGYDEGVIYPDYAFFHLTLPQLIQAEDPTRYYQPSSPFSPEGQSPARDDMGDQHNWQVSLEHSDYRKFRELECRMMNEGGFLGPNALPTLQACFPDPSSASILDFAWRHHDNSVDSWHRPSLPNAGFRDHLGIDLRTLDLETYTYLGGCLQGEAMSAYVENFRRRAFDSSAACFWMFNDCWPATRSWTIVDYYCRRTPAFWAVKRAFAPLGLVLAQIDDRIAIFAVNDSDERLSAQLRHGVFTTRGEYLSDTAIDVTIEPNASTLLATQTALSEEEGTLSIPFAVLSDPASGRLFARNRLILPKLKALQLTPPTIETGLENGVLNLRAPQFVLGVCLDLDGESPLADNFFDLYPNQAYTIPWSSPTIPPILDNANNHLAATMDPRNTY